MQTLYAIVTTSAVGGVCLHLMPKHSKMTPYIQLLLSLVLLLMLLSPLMTLIQTSDWLFSGDVFDSYHGEVNGDFYDDAITSGVIARASSSLAALLSAETGIAVQDMKIDLTTSSTNDDDGIEITVTAVTVTLYRREHYIAAEKIRAAAERALLCPCRVELEVGEDA